MTEWGKYFSMGSRIHRHVGAGYCSIRQQDTVVKVEGYCSMRQYNTVLQHLEAGYCRILQHKTTGYFSTRQQDISA
jgi:hypothetical protein